MYVVCVAAACLDIILAVTTELLELGDLPKLFLFSGLCMWVGAYFWSKVPR